MRDIKERDDIEFLVDCFYKKILADEMIGSIFTDTIKFVWENHIPTMYDFWDSVLFGVGGYTGNLVMKHIELNKKMKLTESHFDQWLLLWKEAIEENFKGSQADLAYEKAETMKTLLMYKIKLSSDDNFIQ